MTFEFFYFCTTSYVLAPPRFVRLHMSDVPLSRFPASRAFPKFWNFGGLERPTWQHSARPLNTYARTHYICHTNALKYKMRAFMIFLRALSALFLIYFLQKNGPGDGEVTVFWQKTTVNLALFNSSIGLLVYILG